MNQKEIIFIISQPRCGSTLLQKILSNHSKVATHSEPWALLPILSDDLYLKIKADREYNEYIANNAVTDFFLGDRKKRFVFKSTLIDLYINNIEQILKSEKKSIFIDKTPRYYFIGNKIQNYFPNSKIIVITRSPFDIINSIIDTWIGNKIFLLNNFTTDLFKAPININKLLSHKNTIQVKYENLISETEFEIKKILKFLDLDYEEGIIEKKRNINWNLGDPKINLYSSINKNSLNSWKKNISTQKWRIYRDYSRNNIFDYYEKFGYDVENIKSQLEKLKPSKILLFFSLSNKFIFSNFSKKFLYKFQRKIKYLFNKN